MIELLQRTPTKLTDVRTYSPQVGPGQVVHVPFIEVSFPVPNHALDQLDPTGRLLSALYREARRSERTALSQQELDGIEPVSRLPQLTDAGKHIKRFEWHGQQAGCLVIFHQGLNDRADIRLIDATTKKLRLAMQPNGVLEAKMAVLGSPLLEHLLDAQTLGRLSMMHNTEAPMTIRLPATDQPQLYEDEQEQPRTPGLTPIDAFISAAAIGRNLQTAGTEPAEWPFGAEAAQS